MDTPSKDDLIYDLNNQIEYHERQFDQWMNNYRNSLKISEYKWADEALNKASNHASVLHEMRHRYHKLKWERRCERVLTEERQRRALHDERATSNSSEH